MEFVTTNPTYIELEYLGKSIHDLKSEFTDDKCQRQKMKHPQTRPNGEEIRI